MVHREAVGEEAEVEGQRVAAVAQAGAAAGGRRPQAARAAVAAAVVRPRCFPEQRAAVARVAEVRGVAELAAGERGVEVMVQAAAVAAA